MTVYCIGVLNFPHYRVFVLCVQRLEVPAVRDHEDANKPDQEVSPAISHCPLSYSFFSNSYYYLFIRFFMLLYY